MPDPNKFDRLREIGYAIPPICLTCIHAERLPSTIGFGLCGLHRYVHARQNTPIDGRGVSIHSFGTCQDHKPDPARIARLGLGAHTEFVR